MYSKNIEAKCVGIKKYTKNKENGTTYTLTMVNIVYENKENKNLTGLEAECVKTNLTLNPGTTYKMCVVTQKVEDRYYKEIVSAEAIK